MWFILLFLFFLNNFAMVPALRPLSLRFETKKVSQEIIEGKFLHYYEITAYDSATNQWAGYISLDDREINDIGHIEVDPSMRNRGVAKALFAQATKFAREQGKGHVYWGITSLTAPRYDDTRDMLMAYFKKMRVKFEKRTDRYDCEYEVAIYSLLNRLA